MMDITAQIAKPLMRVDFKARNKEEALRGISVIACQSPMLAGHVPDDIYKLLVEREGVVSTGIGNGVAIPHVRLPGLADFLVFFLVAPQGVDFEALDGKKVQIFFVVFAPADKVNEHLKVLAGISFALSRTNLKREMLKATAPEILYEVVVRNLRGEAHVNGAATRKKLLVVVLYMEELLNDILEFLIDHDIEGATILRSEGMGTYISNLPLFASFMDFMSSNKNTSHTILALIPAEAEQMLVQGIESLTGDLDKKRGAMLMTLDVAFSKGTMTML
jgi:nitrogen PTS system EIIA component